MSAQRHAFCVIVSWLADTTAVELNRIAVRDARAPAATAARRIASNGMAAGCLHGPAFRAGAALATIANQNGYKAMPLESMARDCVPFGVGPRRWKALRVIVCLAASRASNAISRTMEGQRHQTQTCLCVCEGERWTVFTFCGRIARYRAFGRRLQFD